MPKKKPKQSDIVIGLTLPADVVVRLEKAARLAKVELEVVIVVVLALYAVERP